MKYIKRVLFLVSSLILAITLLSCNSAKEYKPHMLQDLILYKDEEVTKDGLRIKNNYSYKEYYF